MTKWEYCDVTWKPDQVAISFCKLGEDALVRTYETSLWPQLLARLGDEGWEMTGCVGSPMQVHEYFYYFKRPVEE